MSIDNPTIQRCPHDEENPYLQVSRSLIRDNRISPECRWLIIYLLANKDNWKIYVKKLIADLKPHMGKDKIYALLNEAIDFGYVKRERFFVNGLERIRYFVSEAAKFKNPQDVPERKSLSIYPLPENPDAENPDAENPDAENPDAKERIIGKKEQKKDIAPPAIADAMCKYLHGEIKKLKPNYSKPISKAWIKNAEKLLKIRSPEELRKVIDWVMRDTFWNGVILSPDSLEKNLDKIEMQMVKKSDSKSSLVTTVEDNKKLAEMVAQKFPTESAIVLGYNYIEFNFGRDCVHMKFSDVGFKELLQHNLRRLHLPTDGL